MTRTLSPVTAALCLIVASIAAVQAGPISIPNGDFNTVYKPGTTIAARYFGSTFPGGWTNSAGAGVGVGTSDGTNVATFDDETTSPTVDIPNWVSTGGGGIASASGWSFCGYSNSTGTLSQTISGITAQDNVTYTISADLFGPDATVLATNAHLWFGGTEIIATDPTPWTPTGTWTTFTKQFQVNGVAPVGELKVVFDFSGDEVATKIDNVALAMTVPEPAALSLLGLGAAGLWHRRRR